MIAAFQLDVGCVLRTHPTRGAAGQAALKIPEDRFVGLDDSKTVEIAGVRITGLAAAHELLDQDAASGRGDGSEVPA